MMTRSRKGDSIRSTTEEETSTEQTTTDATATTESSMNTNQSIMEVDKTVIPTSPRSRKSGTTSKKKELEARLELEKLKLEEIKMKAQMAATKLELEKMNENTDESDVEAEEEAITSRATADWVKKSRMLERDEGERVRDAPRTSMGPGTTPNTSRANQLADAIMEAIKSASSEKTPPTLHRAPKYVSELHPFDGDARDWIAFKATYCDTKELFTAIENMGRLRKAIRGKAKEAVKSLLYTQIKPEEVINALERRFGRPTYLIQGEIDNIEKLPPMTEDAKELVRYAGAIANTVSVVKQMKKQSYLHSSDISNRIIEKMCTLIRFKWYEFRAAKEDEDEPILISLMEFFNQLVDRIEVHDSTGVRVKKENTRFRTRNLGSRGVHTARTMQYENEEEYTSQSEESDEELEERKGTATVCACNEKKEKESREWAKQKCPLCEGEHFLMRCKKFNEATVPERWDIIRKQGICFKCLSGRHRRYSCKTRSCSKCQREHHTLLHSDEPLKPRPQETQTIASTVNTTITSNQVYLKIIPVELFGPNGKMEAHALMDEGSTVTLLEESVAARIGAKGPEDVLRLEGIGGHRIEQPSMKLNTRIKGLFARNYENMICHTVKSLELAAQEINEKDVADCHHLADITDQLMYPYKKPTLLIGQDNWNLIVTQQIRQGDRNKPVASKTQLGWVLHGIRLSNCRPINVVSHVVSAHASKDDRLEKLIREHFSVDALGIEKKKPKSDIDQRAMEVLESKTRKLENGRFSTGLLWKTDEEVLPESRAAAARRQKGLEKKFERNPEIKTKYEEQIENLLKSEYAEEITDVPTSPRTWYLPHFAVIHPQKKKIRVVFDAAAKSNGKALNDALLPGPDMLQPLFGVLIRFRQGPVAVMADIKEMFLRIQINEEDRDSLRFLWNRKEYRMRSLIFGATSSPCTAIYVKNKNAEKYQETLPEAVKAITRNHYMDDYLASYSDVATARRISRQVNDIHKEGGFHLRGWASNENQAIEEFKGQEVELKTMCLAKPQINEIEKTLGLNWSVREDDLHFTLSLRNTPAEAVQGERTPTKREATSAVMSVFDPLGLASPITIQGKAMLQNLWRCGIEWDEKLPPAREQEWRKWIEDLRLLQDLRIPRCLSREATEGELHTFCDASEKAYACAVYWRPRHPDGHIEVKLLAGKARVSPLKAVSIPRLELQACLLGSRLTTTLQEELEFSVTQRYFWTDSRTALAWIKSDPRRFKPFVAHRLAEIEELTRQKEWRWVPTKHNVADDATRETPTSFNIEHRWFMGPKFLYEEQQAWPADTSTATVEDTIELKPNSIVMTIKQPPADIPEPSRFSKWLRLLRATARFLQAVDVFKSKILHANTIKKITKQREDPVWKKIKKKEIKKTTMTDYHGSIEESKYIPLTMYYIEKAERLLIQTVQKNSFAEEIKATDANKTIKGASKLRNLDVKMENDILRIATRISAANYVPESYKSPIVLDGKHYITRLLVEHLHEAFGHGNHQTVMNEIRQKYWVTPLRELIKSVARHCRWCRLRKAAPQAIPQGDLPPERLRKGSAPFTCTAVDYFGPMHVTIGRRVEKRWCALFTCLTTRAVHLELASSLSADSMILALRRMIARRGTPRILYSDNGTNFISANKEIANEINKMSQKTTENGIIWKFIPPGAPNMGGSWERLVRTVKVALSATLKERHPKEEVLHTLLLEAEHIVNSRPLFTVDLQPEEEEALTPNHFLIGRSCGTSIFGSFDDTALYGSPNWKKSQRLADHFWSRWVREYLPTLAPRYYSGPTYQDPAIGDIVLIVDHTLPRCSWPRGQIIKTYPGPDEKVRVVDVRTSAGILRRPASRLVIIEPASEEESPPQRRKVTSTEGEIVGDEHG